MARKKNAKNSSYAISKNIEVVKRRIRVLELKEMGASIRQISQRLTDEALAEFRTANPGVDDPKAERKAVRGCSPTRVQELLVEALEDLYRNQRLKTRHMVQLELNKMDRIELAHLSRLLKSTTPDSIEKLSRALERVWKRRDALLGLHKPLKVELDPRQTLAKLLGRSPEELPDGDPDA